MLIPIFSHSLYCVKNALRGDHVCTSVCDTAPETTLSYGVSRNSVQEFSTRSSSLLTANDPSRTGVNEFMNLLQYIIINPSDISTLFNSITYATCFGHTLTIYTHLYALSKTKIYMLLYLFI
jgi:hypothetical protein